MLTLLLSTAFANPPVPPPIVGGEETSDYPAVGNLCVSQGNYCSPFCSGTLIEKSWVMTAAHCVEPMLNEFGDAEVYFVMGPSLWDYEDYALVSRGIMHPQYGQSQQGGLNFDTGLVELASPVTSVQPMPVNTEAVTSAWHGKPIIYVGYGVTGDNDNNSSGVKRTATIDIFDHDNMTIFTSDQTGQQNVCYGDSGGAALYWDGEKLVLAGVNSFVWPQCEGGNAGAARVDASMNFINTYLELPEIEPEDPDYDEDGYTEEDGDCDNEDASVYPEADEIPDDGIDQDCDGEDLVSPPVEEEIAVLKETPVYSPSLLGCATSSSGSSMPIFLMGLLMAFGRRRKEE